MRSLSAQIRPQATNDERYNHEPDQQTNGVPSGAPFFDQSFRVMSLQTGYSDSWQSSRKTAICSGMKIIDGNMSKSNPVVEAPVVVDLFCGAGGLAYGMQTAGCKIAAGVDLDPSCKYALETNTSAEFVCRDVSKVTPSDLNEWFGSAKVRVLAGCAPCQPFSTYSQSRKTEDKRWNLLLEFLRLAVSLTVRDGVPRPQGHRKEFSALLR